MAEENNKENTEQNEQNTKTENTKFYSLAPVESDNYDKYNDAFKFALNHNGKSKKITNITVTGPYASGKSSVIENVKKEFGTYNFITLSLTNFNSGDMEDDDKIKENSITNKKIEEDLEAQLINQLIHKIESKKIEYSRFLANNKIDTSKLSYKVGTFIHTLIISIIFICLVIVNISDETISKIFFSKIADIKSVSINILLILGSIYSLYSINKTITLFKKRRILRKINIYGNEIELFNNDDDSIFDKYTDEILYLFKNAGVKYFIFEDIDRYEDVTIFKKLREINILLNETLKREDKEYKPIKFIYLICDNMFTAEERTKFFDFIIPVVPYIHKGNAYDYMAELFADEIKDERNKKFLIKVSLFIDNSRLIKNIANEYYIYSKFIKLQDRKPHTKFIKLLSLIIYKNLFPKDFNQLYFNKGYLAELFHKEEFAKQDEINLDDLKYKTIKECIDLNEDSNKFFKAPKGYDYIYNGGYFNLIKFLVEDGYIDETYKDYMSAITENYLTYEERAFLQNIAAHNGEQFLTYLTRINEKIYLENFLNFIDIEETKRLEILNIYLLENISFQYLINGELKFKIIYDTILKNLVSKNTDYLFINFYYQYLISLYNITENENIDINTNPYTNFTYIIIYYYKTLTHNISTQNNITSLINVILNILMVYKRIFTNPNDKIKKEIEEIKLDISTNEFYISALEKNLTDDILFCYRYEHYNKNQLFYYANTQQNNTSQLSIEDIDKEKWLTQDILDLLKETGIYLNNINIISSIDFFNLVLNTQSFDVNYKNILYIAERFNPNANMQYLENVFDTLLNLQDKSLQEYIFNNFDKLIKTYNNNPLYYIEIEKETYNKMLESEFISDEHKKIINNRFKPY